MKSATPELAALLAGSQQFRIADCYTFTLSGGTVARYTGADVPITVGANVFAANDIIIRRSGIRLVVGVEVDTLNLDIAAKQGSTINGVPWPAAARLGVLDGARLKVERAFLGDWLQPAAGALWLFEGRVAEVEVERLHIRLAAKCDLELLNVMLPRNVYQAGCVHSVYDAGCGLSAAAYTVSGAATSGSSTAVINCNLTQANAYFNLGALTFTSGANSGVSRAVREYTVGQIAPSVPLPYAPQAGDTFTIKPGCDKLAETCNAKFGNKRNFRGYTTIPVPEVLL